MSRRKLKSQLLQFSRPKDPTPGKLGDYSRTVTVPGRPNYVYVRLSGHVLTQAFNNRVPNKYDRRVLVGYDPLQPHLFQVLGLQSDLKIYGETTKTESQQMLHHASHEWGNSDGGNDVVFVELRQFMPARPMPLYVSGTSVFVNRAVGWIGSQWQKFTGSAFNVGGYVPSTGAIFGLLYIDTNGLLNFSGGARKDLNTLRISDIPSPVPGTLPIAAIRLYSNQTGVAEAITDTDLVDLRFPMAHDHKFRELSDVPRSYSGQATKYPRVNASETGLEFVSITGGTSGFGHVIQDEGVAVAQQGILNFVGSGVEAVNDPVNSRTVVRVPGTISIYQSGAFKVSGTAFSFYGLNTWAVSSGSVAYFGYSGTAIQDEGITLLQRGTINFVGDGVVAVDDSANSRTVVRIPGTISFYQSGVFKVSGTSVVFYGSNVWVNVTGSTAFVSISGSSGGGGGHTIQDDGVNLTQRTNLNFVGDGFATGDNGSDTTIVSGTGRNITVYNNHVTKHTAVSGLDFGANLTVTVTGSTAFIDLNTSGTTTYMRAGSPIALAGATGTYWRIPEGQYSSGTLSLFINGVAQNPVTNYTEQYSMSGTFVLADMPPTGSIHTVIWGAPVSMPGINVSTYSETLSGTGTSFTTQRTFLPGTVRLYLNGVRQGTNQYTETSPRTITTSFFVATGDLLVTDYGVDSTLPSFMSTVDNSVCQGRLTLTSGTSVTTADVTDATSVFYTPHNGNRISLYNGSYWDMYSFSQCELSLSGLTSGTVYDVFAYASGSSVAIESLAWASSSARNTDISKLNGVYTKSTDTTRRYVGTFRCSNSGKCSDSDVKRFVWNYYNRVQRFMYFEELTSHTYNGAVRKWNNSNTNNLAEFVIGVIEDALDVSVRSSLKSANSSSYAVVSAYLDTVIWSGGDTPWVGVTYIPNLMYVGSTYKKRTAIGYHYLEIYETANATATFVSVRLEGTYLG